MSKELKELEASRNEYKGHEMVVLEKGRSKFQCGYTKARLIVEGIEHIRAFVKEIEQEKLLS